MLDRFRASTLLLLFPLVLAGMAAACGSNSNGSDFVPPGKDSGTTDGTTGTDTGATGDGGPLFGEAGEGGGSSGGDSAAGFDVEPSTLQTVTVTLGQPIPTVVFHATNEGLPVAAGWCGRSRQPRGGRREPRRPTAR